jgi:hypothetical protein
MPLTTWVDLRTPFTCLPVALASSFIRWTIPALAEKFRIRRQRVMAILALKEIQAHK